MGAEQLSCLSSDSLSRSQVTTVVVYKKEESGICLVEVWYGAGWGGGAHAEVSLPPEVLVT